MSSGCFSGDVYGKLNVAVVGGTGVSFYRLRSTGPFIGIYLRPNVG